MDQEIPKEKKEICLKLLSLFKIDGMTGDQAVSAGQLNIFYNIVFRPHNRLQILTCTQYGKSLIVALACIIVSCFQDEKIAILAPKNEMAKIIMRYYLEHIGDNVLFYSQLEAKTKLERLRQEENKERIVLKRGGGIFVVSVQAGNSRKGIESAMGAGSRIVILDEASLIPDQIEATTFRMIAGKGENAFYCKIGNPFYLNHFHKTWHKDRYKKIFIDYQQALSEGRYTEEFIEEAKENPMFDILYGCKFPDRDEIDDRGYRFLISEQELEEAFIDELPEELMGSRRLGVDVGRGSNYSAFVVRHDNVMWLESKNQSSNLMTQVDELGRIKGDEIFIDDVGVGGGVTDRANELGYNVIGIREGSSANNSDIFANIKAENYFELKRWINKGGKILRHQDWRQLLEVKYKRNSSGRTQLEPKDEMFKRGVKSPDIADAGSLTFNEFIEPGVDFI